MDDRTVEAMFDKMEILVKRYVLPAVVEQMTEDLIRRVVREEMQKIIERGLVPYEQPG